MSLKELLSEVDSTYPPGREESEIPEWINDRALLSFWFFEEVELVFAIARELLPERIFTDSKIESLTSDPESRLICFSQLRPQNRFYPYLKLPIPYPENPKGLDATGFEFSISLLKGILALNSVYLPAITIKFMVWGEVSRKAFQSFFQDYRGLIGRFLSPCRLEFETARVFPNLEAYKGRDLVGKLDRYFKNEDDEASFTIWATFTRDSNFKDLVQASLRLLVIYDCCMGYIGRSKNKERLIHYYDKLIGLRKI